MPPPNGNEKKPCQKQRDWLDYATFAVGLLTLIFLLIYTVINYCLYRTTADSFHAANRAWVGWYGDILVKGNPDVTWIKDDPFGRISLPIGYRVKNVGAAPALEEISLMCIP